MSRVPYETVVIEVDRIIVRMASSVTCERANYYWSQYIGYIEACGWTDQEFDRETMKRVDASWLIKRQAWN